ncbi:glutathione S-transferase T2-like [Salvia divinorum]|uniref:Glutathione S-transferase T2-like n=1 Tax=Salvia divinorum TaxID=28513 RepID=A0ABD1H6S7_SALDI
MGEQRSLKSLRQRYKRLNTNVSKWIGAYKRAHDRATSGQSKEDIEKTAQQLYGKSKFTHHKVFESVMRHNPKWELKLNSTGSTRFQSDEDSLEESRGSSKRSRTSEEGGPQINSTPGTLREMRVTRERECDIQERKIKAAILTPLMARKDLSPEEEEQKRQLIAELFGK